VAASGGSNENDGSVGSPWATLAYAVTQASAGDTVYMNAGSHTIDATVSVPVGVSITGAGATSIINYTNTTANQPCLALISTPEGTDGNQSISYIKMDGGDSASWAIDVRNRDSVLIHNCTFEDFFVRGVTFHGHGYSTGQPDTYATGNKFYSNTVHDCSDYYGEGKTGNVDGRGALGVGGQHGILVYDNTFTQDDRGANANGYLIKYGAGGYNKGLKIYNNTITKTPYDSVSYDFAIELWNCQGGIEIYNNTIQGAIDFGGTSTTDAGGYGFAAKIYNNIIGQATLRDQDERGIYLELEHTGGMYIYKNRFYNLYEVLECYQSDGDVFEDLYFYYNTIENVGTLGEAWRGNTTLFSTLGTGVTATYDNINFFNNTIYAGTSAQPVSGLLFNFEGTATNVTVKNNIIYGFPGYAITISSTTIDTLTIQNNLMYSNGASNIVKFISPDTSEYTYSGNRLGENPQFASSDTFALAATSPAINQGLDLSLAFITTDILDSTFIGLPDMGAYEYISEEPPTEPLIATTTAPSQIKTNSAVGGGTVTYDGGGTVSARGVCWSTSANPTTSDSITTDGTGTGTFTSSITGLTSSTTYHVRAYATNETGTSYGADYRFSTTNFTRLKSNNKYIKALSDYTVYQTQDSLLAYYKLDDTTGTTVYSTVGRVNGTTNATVNATGKLGKAIDIAANEKSIVIPYGSRIIPTGTTMTVAFWVKFDAMSTALSRTCRLLRLNNSTNFTMDLYVSATDSTIEGNVKDSEDNIYYIHANTSLVVDTWYHIVCVVSSGSDTKIYVNGVDDTNGTDTNTFSGNIKAGDEGWVFGNTVSDGNYAIDGVIDEIAIFNNAFNQGGVTYYYNEGNGRTY
jgi:hypothetical protein